MAKLLFSSLIDGMRGRTGGVVFGANASGPYVKRFAPPLTSNTAKQLTRRQVFSSWASSWRSLTNTQRANWNTYAAAAPQEKFDSLGNSYFLNGFQWYVALNTNLNLVGRSPISNAPVIAVPSAPTIGTLTITAPGIASCTQGFTVASFGANDMVIELNFTSNQGKQVPKNKNYRFCVGVQNGSLATPKNLGNLQLIFGVISSNTYWFSRVYAQTTEGRRSTYVIKNTVAV